ncbi:hypothetical protein BH11PLA2_BH11PLA2_41290 [soil metagenome]
MRFLIPFVAVCLANALAIADPLKYMPLEAGVVMKVESPRTLVEGFVKLDAYKEVQAFPQVKEVLDSANARRLFQLLKYVEAETKTAWPELIDKVAGNGIALGFKPGMDNAPVLLVMEGTDEAIVTKVFNIFLAGVKDEAARNDSVKIIESEIAGVRTLQLGDATFARHGSLIFISNKKVALEAGLTLALKPGERKSILEHATLGKARKLVGDKAAAWLWFDLAAAKETQEGKDYFANSRKDLFQLLAFGSTSDAARRSEFVAAGLYDTPKGYTFSVRMPAKRADLDDVMYVHVPPKSLIGSKPLLEPKGVVLSQSFYLDVGYLWGARQRIIANEELKSLETGVAQLSKLLPNTSMEELLVQSGAYHRFVMAHTGEKLYTNEPNQLIPPTAYVGTIRFPEFGKSINGILRAGGLVAGFQTGWTMKEEKHDGVAIVTYRFPDVRDAKFDDPDHLRFNAAPSFAIVNDSLIVASTPGIIKELIPILRMESKEAGEPEVWRMKGYAAGAADVLAAYPEATVTDAILRQGITLAEAKQQTIAFSKWLRKLGSTTISIQHDVDMYKFEIEVKLK